jgi:2-phosphosulfolactate phosphatase
VVLSITNGTRIIEAAHCASAILAGAFVKAHAIADKLATGTWGTRVAVIRCGWEGRRSGEDESTTGAILHRMREKGAGLDERVERVVGLYLACPKKSSLRCNSAARRLIRLGYEQDLDFCLRRERSAGCSLSQRGCLRRPLIEGNLARGPNRERGRA